MSGSVPVPTAEQSRLHEADARTRRWRQWGPYLSERQWGTVREDYSPTGAAWDYFPFEAAHSRAYRWGEDGIAGISDEGCRLCLSLALWNGQDPILKDRLYGLSNGQGNRGEDVKELYYYLDATPTHSWLRMLYKYPQREFPYHQLLAESRSRGRLDPEFELLDTGIFDDDRYFDVFVEYSKEGPQDILMRIEVHNRGPAAATIHLLPQLWFRNTWSWSEGAERPELLVSGPGTIQTQHPSLGSYQFAVEGEPEFLVCDNNTNSPKLYGTSVAGFFKDGINDRVVGGNVDRVNPSQRGTKGAAWVVRTIPAQGQVVLRARLSPRLAADPFADFDSIHNLRRQEADEFYDHLQTGITGVDERLVQRQALAGMIWSKQFYHYDVPDWLAGDPLHPPPPEQRKSGRNRDWRHLNNSDIVSMPDKWEYPWYAAWDLAFHAIPLALVDASFAKQQLLLLTREWYMHPNGQLPAYEWNFSDVNPPVHAWAAWRVFQMDRKQRGDRGDIEFLERVFHKLMLNFTWWVNRKDASGRNIFQGGFLGLDNIGVFNRSDPLPTGGYINQADGTSWMAMYSLNLMRIALELALHNRVYEDIATKFFEHFLHIAEAMTNMGGTGENRGLWHERDQFYYDSLELPHGQAIMLEVRSMVGLIPLFAVETLEPELLDRLPDFHRRLRWFLANRPDLAKLVSRWNEPGLGERGLLSLLRGSRMKKLLKRMLDETEFLSEYGVRALSKHHADNPYTFDCDGTRLTVSYIPGESESGLFGGNSNWRGPNWMPVNYLIIESLQKFHHYYGDDFQVECPTGSGRYLTLNGVADELSRRLTRLFLRDSSGRRSAFGDHHKQQFDPHFRDNLLFHEYFHGDTGRGLGACHQTGWTGLVAKLLMPRKGDAGGRHGDDGPASHHHARPEEFGEAESCEFEPGPRSLTPRGVQ
ncbi:MAG: glucosidase [Planctomycetota bacterium]|nr:glucosidase [Planctomycetota bacterium]